MTVVVDTGVLVALIDPDTREHAWAREEAARLPVPFLTSEAILTETAFVLARDGFDADELFYRRHRNKVIPVLIPEE